MKADLLRKLLTAIHQTELAHTIPRELLAEVEAYLESPLAQREYLVYYLERKLEAAAKHRRGGCTLSLGLTEDIVAHLKQNTH